MSKFEVGDRVKCIRGSDLENAAYAVCRTGQVYTVAAVTNFSDGSGRQQLGLAELREGKGEWFSDRFIHLTQPTTLEADPNGIDQHAPGAKLDAGKLRPALVLDGFANALEAVVKVGTDGAAKYTDNGWKEVANGFARYSDAEGRHRLKRGKGETHDKDSGSLHLAHEAWNALAKLELYLKDNA